MVKAPLTGNEVVNTVPIRMHATDEIVEPNSVFVIKEVKFNENLNKKEDYSGVVFTVADNRFKDAAFAQENDLFEDRFDLHEEVIEEWNN